MSANDPLSEPAADDAIRVQPTEITADLVPGPRPDYSEERIESSLPAAGSQPHPGFWWSLLWSLGFFLCTQIPGVVVCTVVLLVLTFARPDLFPANVADQKAMMGSQGFSISLAFGFTTSQILAVGLSLLVIRLVVGADWKRQLALRRPGLAHLVLVLAGCPAFVLLGNWSYVVLRQVLHVPSISQLGLPGGMEEAEKLFASWPMAVGILVIGLGPGIGEELWCRGFLGRGLVGRYGPAIGVVLTSFFFGLIHGDPAQGSMALLMGLWLHFVYLMTRSLWMSMLVHFLNNSFAVVAPRFAAFKVVDSGLAMPPYLVAASVLLMAGVGWALYRSRARLVPEKDGADLWQPPYPGVAYPPPGSGTRVAHPRPSWDALAAAGAGAIVFVAACVLVASLH